MSNPLFDMAFLQSLLTQNNRTLYARIIALTQEELPIEYIEGKATAGSVNIDGNSAVRRTCSLTLVAQNVNINEFYWGLKTKFRLEIGVKNEINSNYEDIVWFKQGTFVITSFSVSYGTNSFTINISGKDKMCLLNGDLGGALPHITDFGIEETYNSETNITTYESVPIRRIIRESVQNFGNELASNIIINDIEDAGLDLLEYRGDIPLFLLKEINSDIFTNMTINQNQPCFIQSEDDDEWYETTIGDSSKIKYYNLVHIDDVENNPTPIKLRYSDDANIYVVAKMEYGSIPGYRLTDLVYAGDLIANVGETLTSVLDKIKNMLGNYEYFYNLDGKFIFQKKRNYVQLSWLNVEQSDDASPANNDVPMWDFKDSQLITTFQNTPNFANLKNDYAVWGTKKTTAGSELDIHMRFAIDEKPENYYSLLDDKEYSVANGWDWRELIYKMALDYRRFYHDDNFLYNLAQKNPQYPTGKTGYEQYYVDMEGFWRQLYNPNPEAKFKEVEDFSKINENVFIHNGYRHPTKEEYENLTYKEAFIIESWQDGNEEIMPFKNYSRCRLENGQTYWYKTKSKGYSSHTIKNIDEDTFFKFFNIESIYIEQSPGIYIKLVEDEFKKVSADIIYIKDKTYQSWKQLPQELQKVYYKNGEWKKEISYKKQSIYGRPTEVYSSPEIVFYYQQYFDYGEDYWANAVKDNPETLLFWFDFLDANGSELSKYSVKNVGIRAKALNDKDVKSIYYREIPNVIFQTGEEEFEHKPGYVYIQLQNTMENLFTISSKGKSAKERIEELLYDNGCCIESISITALPIYHLEPNSRIKVYDNKTNIDGEYIVNKITIPLTYNGTMNISATKVVTELT